MQADMTFPSHYVFHADKYLTTENANRHYTHKMVRIKGLQQV